jgi:hypothetical protein
MKDLAMSNLLGYPIKSPVNINSQLGDYKKKLQCLQLEYCTLSKTPITRNTNSVLVHISSTLAIWILRKKGKKCKLGFWHLMLQIKKCQNRKSKNLSWGRVLR